MAHDRGILVAVDGAQGAGMFECNLKEMGCDFYTASAHKWMFAPKEVGFLVAEVLDIADAFHRLQAHDQFIVGKQGVQFSHVRSVIAFPHAGHKRAEFRHIYLVDQTPGSIVIQGDFFKNVKAGTAQEYGKQEENGEEKLGEFHVRLE